MLVNRGWQRRSGAKPDVHVQDHWVGNLCISAPRTGESFGFPADEIPPGRKPCTADIGIDLLLRSDPDIYLPANCKRQDPLSEERERFTEK